MWFKSQSWLLLWVRGQKEQPDNSSTCTGRLRSTKRGWWRLVNHQQLTTAGFWRKGLRLAPITPRETSQNDKAALRLCDETMGWLSVGSGSRCCDGVRVNALIRKSKEEIRTRCRNYICYETICSTREITKGASLHMVVLCWLIRSRLRIYPAGLYLAP